MSSLVFICNEPQKVYDIVPQCELDKIEAINMDNFFVKARRTFSNIRRH